MPNSFGQHKTLTWPRFRPYVSYRDLNICEEMKLAHLDVISVPLFDGILIPPNLQNTNIEKIINRYNPIPINSNSYLKIT